MASGAGQASGADIRTILGAAGQSTEIVCIGKMGCWCHTVSHGLTVKERVRYVGFLLGHVAGEQAHAPEMAKMKARFAFLKTLLFDLREKADLFKIWVQPLVHLIAPGGRLCGS